jgi:hypothetical protein
VPGFDIDIGNTLKILGDISGTYEWVSNIYTQICVPEFRYVEVIVTNENCNQEEIERRLNLGSASNESRIFCPLVCCQNTIKLE